MSQDKFLKILFSAYLVQKFGIGRIISLAYAHCNAEESHKSFRLVGPQRQPLREQA